MRWVGRPDIEAVQIGDEVRLPINCLRDTAPWFDGKVVYIHPKKRFFTVQFTENGIRESYCAYGPLS